MLMDSVIFFVPAEVPLRLAVTYPDSGESEKKSRSCEAGLKCYPLTGKLLKFKD